MKRLSILIFILIFSLISSNEFTDILNENYKFNYYSSFAIYFGLDYDYFDYEFNKLNLFDNLLLEKVTINSLKQVQDLFKRRNKLFTIKEIFLNKKKLPEDYLQFTINKCFKKNVLAPSNESTSINIVDGKINEDTYPFEVHIEGYYTYIKESKNFDFNFKFAPILPPPIEKEVKGRLKVFDKNIKFFKGKKNRDISLMALDVIIPSLSWYLLGKEGDDQGMKILLYSACIYGGFSFFVYLQNYFETGKKLKKVQSKKDKFKRKYERIKTYHQLKK